MFYSFAVCVSRGYIQVKMWKTSQCWRLDQYEEIEDIPQDIISPIKYPQGRYTFSSSVPPALGEKKKDISRLADLLPVSC